MKYLRIIFLLTALVPAAVFAQTWTGGANDSLWNSAGNWSPSGAPATAATVTMSGSIDPNVNLATAVSLTALNFSSGAGNFVLTDNSGNATAGITITGASGASISNASGATQTFDTGVTFSNNGSGVTTTTSGSNIIFNNTVTVNGQITVSPYTGQTITINGAIASAGAAADRIDMNIPSGVIGSKTAGGNFVISSSSTGSYASSRVTVGNFVVNGNITVTSGIFIGYGAATVVAGGASLSGTGVINGAVTIANGETFNPGLSAVGGNSTGTFTINGTLTLGGAPGSGAGETGAPIINFTNGDSIAVNGSVVSSAVTTLNLTGYGIGQYQLFSLTGTSLTPAQFTFTGISGGDVASLSSTGLLSIASAIPEPGTTALLIGAFAFTAVISVRRRKAGQQTEN